jgi:hypothetical protein
MLIRNYQLGSDPVGCGTIETFLKFEAHIKITLKNLFPIPQKKLILDYENKAVNASCL